MNCLCCGSNKFRISLLKPGDFFWLLALKRPVRCRICSQRQYVGLAQALFIRHADKIRHQGRKLHSE